MKPLGDQLYSEGTLTSGRPQMKWRTWLNCSCGNKKPVDNQSRNFSDLCDCGNRMIPTFYEYGIDIAMLGGHRYILGELEYLKTYKPISGLEQFQFGKRVRPTIVKENKHMREQLADIQEAGIEDVKGDKYDEMEDDILDRNDIKWGR